MIVSEGCHKGGEGSGGCRSNELELQVGGCGVDVGDNDITIIFLDGCGRFSVAIGGSSINTEVLNLVFDGRVVVFPYSPLSRFCFLLGCEELAAMLRLLSRVCVNTSEAFFKKELGEIFAVYIEGADETTDFVYSLDIDLDVSLKAPSVCEVMSLLSEGVRFFVCIAG